MSGQDESLMTIRSTAIRVRNESLMRWIEREEN